MRLGKSFGLDDEVVVSETELGDAAVFTKLFANLTISATRGRFWSQSFLLLDLEPLLVIFQSIKERIGRKVIEIRGKPRASWPTDKMPTALNQSLSQYGNKDDAIVLFNMPQGPFSLEEIGFELAWQVRWARTCAEHPWKAIQTIAFGVPRRMRRVSADSAIESIPECRMLETEKLTCAIIGCDRITFDAHVVQRLYYSKDAVIMQGQSFQNAGAKAIHPTWHRWWKARP